MYTLLILFFVSLFSIIFMIGRKLVLVKNGYVNGNERAEHHLTPDMEKIKHLTKTSGKRYGYLVLVMTLRLYIRLTNVLKSEYRGLMTKLASLRSRKEGSERVEQEANKFLKMILEYKNKIRDIKHRIHDEEKKF